MKSWRARVCGKIPPVVGSTVNLHLGLLSAMWCQNKALSTKCQLKLCLSYWTPIPHGLQHDSRRLAVCSWHIQWQLQQYGYECEGAQGQLCEPRPEHVITCTWEEGRWMPTRPRWIPLHGVWQVLMSKHSPDWMRHALSITEPCHWGVTIVCSLRKPCYLLFLNGEQGSVRMNRLLCWLAGVLRSITAWYRLCQMHM